MISTSSYGIAIFALETNDLLGFDGSSNTVIQISANKLFHDVILGTHNSCTLGTPVPESSDLPPSLQKVLQTRQHPGC